MSYDRYKKFKYNGVVKNVPFIKIPKRSTDAYEYYQRDLSRLDLISYKYYGDSNYGWLILQANPEFESVEFELNDGVMLRIPLPLEQVLLQLDNDIDNYKKLYSVD